MLPTQSYWIGASRDDAAVPFTLQDGTTLPQTASNTPYAHWSWNINTLAYDITKPTWNCIQVGCSCNSSGASSRQTLMHLCCRPLLTATVA